MIENIKIKNYKCFQNGELSFDRLNVLTGMNGAGKSTILQSLLLLRQSHEQGLLENVGLALNGDYVRIGSSRDALYEKAASDTFGFELKFGTGIAEWAFDYSASDDVPALRSPPVSRQIFSEPLFSNKFQYLQAERIGPRTSFLTSGHAVKRRKWIGTSGEYAVHFLSVYGRKIKVPQILRHKNSASEDLVDQVEAWMCEISPGTRLHSTEILGTDSINLQYSFKFGSETSGKFRSTNVGFGITYSLPILVAALSSAEESIFFVENPEAHIHPSGQLILGGLISLVAEAGAQVFVETHSDHILNGIRLAVHEGALESEKVKICFFRRDSNAACPSQIWPISIDTVGRLSSRPPGFFDQFNLAMDKFMDPSKPYARADIL